MFIFSLLLILIVIIFVTVNARYKYSSILVFYLVSITFMMLIASIYFSKISYYHFPISLDYRIYLNLSMLKFPTYFLSSLYNVGISLFMCSAVYGYSCFYKISVGKKIMLLMPVAVFLFLADPDFEKELFLIVYYSDIINIDISVCDNICKGIMVCYSLFPYTYIVRYWSTEKYVINKHYMKIYAICITILIVFFYYTFVFGTFKSIIFYNVNSIGIPYTAPKINDYTTVVITTTIFLCAVIALLILFKPFSLFDFEYRKNKDIVKNTLLLNKNLSFNMHAYKNAFWSMQQNFELIKTAIQAGDTEDVLEFADAGINTSKQYLENIQNTLYSLTNDVIAVDSIDVIECIESALIKTRVPYNIKIATYYQVRNVKILGNKYILTEVFNNLIMNSVESFQNRHSTPASISIEVLVNGHTCMIEVADNGCGIPKAELKKIFKPFHSTKSKHRNSGMGLNFVQNVIKSYHGEINVLSKVGHYTKFQISLPIYQKNRREKI